MDVDEIAKVAETISAEFKQLDRPRTEWNKWSEYFRRTKDLNKSLILAEKLSNSLMLRGNPKEVYKVITKVIKSKMPIFKSLSAEEVSQVFGFVSWRITSFESKGEGGKKDEKSPRRNFRRQPRRGDRGYR